MASTEAICVHCWARFFGDREPVRITTEHRSPEVCAFCGESTMGGIWLRVTDDDPRLYRNRSDE